MFKMIIVTSLLLLSSVSYGGEINVKVTVDGVVSTNYELVVDTKEVKDGDEVQNGDKSFIIMDTDGEWSDQIDTVIKDGINNINVNISKTNGIKT